MNAKMLFCRVPILLSALGHLLFPTESGQASALHPGCDGGTVDETQPVTSQMEFNKFCHKPVNFCIINYHNQTKNLFINEHESCNRYV